MSLLFDVFEMQQTLGEAFLRSTAIYWCIYLLFRLGGRRNIGSLGFADIVVVILVSEAVGNGLSGPSDTVTDGLVVAAGIVLWSALVDRLGYFFPVVNQILEPHRLLLIKNGVLQLNNMRREYVTRTELMEQLRISGIEELSEVKRAYLESNGEMSVIKEDSGRKSSAASSRTSSNHSESSAQKTWNENL
ncbi:DUF421 domain-containing protein [Advenella kashmirensis]|nr:YetF domain-containing protein [Advenella kashmirensis]